MWTPRWRREGQEPDYRFTLANERTFLAWVRTAMALLAGGVLLDQFAVRLGPRSVLVALAATIAVLAAVLSVAAYRHWRDNEVAMRHGQALPGTRAVPLLAATMLLAAVAIAALIVFA
ncbi:MAG: DUF202 domain-containing protein [Burkholderiales bacterium]|nr:DUF202 domain-containing protein [Burkholderiales bacterium]